VCLFASTILAQKYLPGTKSLTWFATPSLTTKKIKVSSRRIQVGFKILELAEVLTRMSREVGAFETWVGHVAGFCDVDWILPIEKQSLSDKSFYQLVSEHLVPML
jgi:hypothetical protein